MECQNKIAVSRRVLCVLSAPETESLRDETYFAQKLYSTANLFDSCVCLVIQVCTSKRRAKLFLNFCFQFLQNFIEFYFKLPYFNV